MSPEQFLQIADLLPEVMLLLSGEGVILAANRSAGTRLARPPRELEGERLSGFVREPWDSVQQYLLTCSRTSGPVPGALTLARPDGVTIPCHCTGSRLRPRHADEPALVLLRLTPRNESPSQFAILSRRIQELNREIARRRRLEEELREQREWFQVTLSSIGDAVLATDREGRILFMNAVAQSLTGWSEAEALGRPLEEVFRIVNEATREPVENPAHRVLREGLVVGLANDTLLIARDGREWPIADSGAPIRDGSGHILGVVLVFLEITQRKRLEAQLLQQTADLVEADRRKDQYLAMLAHELRNPLGALRNALSVMQQASPEHPAYERAQRVASRQIAQQTRMVDDLLDVSRLTRGTFQVRRELLDLVQLCRQVVEDHRHSVEGAGLILRVEFPGEPAWVEGDPVRLSQVLINLLENAVKFTPPGGEVAVCLEREPDGARARLTVRDTGVGIHDNLLPHVFQAFVQAEQGLAHSEGGLGLGLALVQGFVTLHDGEVRAESAGAGHGATFTVLLPLMTPPPVDEGSGRDAAAPGPLRVLVIEDMRDAAETLRDLLEIWGYRVEVAFTGPEGVEAARRFRPDVVLCDLGLPGMDGFSVARQLRRDPVTTSARLVALTGYGREEDRRRSEEAGFDAHVTKPVDPAALRILLSGAG